MTRFLITTTAAFLASLAFMAGSAAPADAGSLQITVRMGAQDLYPKTTKRLKGYKAQMQRLERAHRKAQQRGDRGLMQRIADKHGQIKTKARKAYAKLKKVRGVTTVTVHGDARRGMDRAEIAAFLRKKRSWQGTSVHFYNRNGSSKASRKAPKTFDGKKKKPAKPSGTGPSSTSNPRPPTGWTPVPVAPGGVHSSGTGGGLFGLGS